METKEVSLEEVLEFLGIEEYKERIFNSSSSGELFHLQDYYEFYKFFNNEDKEHFLAPPIFKKWFDVVIKDANDNWKRPESIYQHIPRIFNEQITKLKEDIKN